MTTKLEAVNDVMRRLGKLPVAALNTGGPSSEGLVERTIDDAATRVMRDGWHWNTKFDVEVTPDGENKVKVSELEAKEIAGYWDIYHVDTYGESSHINVIRSSNYLYDLGENQNTFGDYAKLKLIYVYERDFTEIPPHFVDWIVAISAYNFNMQYIKDKAVMQETGLDMQRTKNAAWREETRAADVNVLETPGTKQLLGRPRMRDRSIQ